MERRNREPVGARFQVRGQSTVVAEQQDAPALRRETARALHRHQRLPGACAAGDSYAGEGGEQLEDVELLLGEPHERRPFVGESRGERGGQRYPRGQQLHELRNRRRREGIAGAYRCFEDRVHRLVGPLQGARVDDQPTRQFRSE